MDGALIRMSHTPLHSRLAPTFSLSTLQVTAIERRLGADEQKEMGDLDELGRRLREEREKQNEALRDEREKRETGDRAEREKREAGLSVAEERAKRLEKALEAEVSKNDRRAEEVGRNAEGVKRDAANEVFKNDEVIKRLTFNADHLEGSVQANTRAIANLPTMEGSVQANTRAIANLPTMDRLEGSVQANTRAIAILGDKPIPTPAPAPTPAPVQTPAPAPTITAAKPPEPKAGNPMEMNFVVRDIPENDTFNDPMVSAFVREPGSKEWVWVGSTEHAKTGQNIEFKQSVVLKGDSKTEVMIGVYDVDNTDKPPSKEDCVGITKTTIGAILSAGAEGFLGGLTKDDKGLNDGQAIVVVKSKSQNADGMPYKDDDDDDGGGMPYNGYHMAS
jgi:hypothetical protein